MHEHLEQRRPFPRLCEIAALPFSAIGRKRLWVALRLRLWPVSYPLAALYRKTLIRHTHVVGVIGSFGKTTTTRAIASMLGQQPSRLGWGFNARGLLVEEILRIPSGTSVAVIEVGTKYKGTMRRSERILRPDLVVVTSIGTEHHRTLGSIAEIRNEKADMVRRLPATGSVLLNGDDGNARWMASQTRAAVMTYGFGEENDIRASHFRSEGLSGGQFDLQVAGQSFSVSTKLVGRHQIYALLAAIAVSQAVDMNLDKTLRAIQSFQPTHRRLWPLQLENGAGLLLDTYKAVFETVEVALDVLEEIPSPHKLVVLGEIFEPPMNEDEAYRALGQRIAQIADGAIYLGKKSAFKSLCDGAGTKRDRFVSAQESVHEAARLVTRTMTSQSVVLLKGVGSQGMERIARLLSGESIDCRRVSCDIANSWECADCRFLRARKS